MYTWKHEVSEVMLLGIVTVVTTFKIGLPGPGTNDSYILKLGAPVGKSDYI